MKELHRCLDSTSKNYSSNGGKRSFEDEEELRRQRYTKRRNKQRQTDYEDEGCQRKSGGKHRNQQEELLPMWKMCLVGAAIFLCIALLYPSVFAPTIGSLFSARRAEDSSSQRNVHPSMQNAHTGQREHIANGRPMHPHPATSAIPQQSNVGGGSRSGFAWLLPFYTVGVVCFLLYTLFKIMFKRKNKKRSKRRSGNIFFRESDEEEGEDESASTNGIHGRKIRSVQTRLRKTEAAMHEILKQLELIAAQPKQQFGASQPTATLHTEKAMVSEEPISCENQIGSENSLGEESTSHLITEQMAQMETRLRELKLLSELCKRDQKLKIYDNSSTEVSDEEEFNVEDEENVDDSALNDDEFISQTEDEFELEEKKMENIH